MLFTAETIFKNQMEAEETTGSRRNVEKKIVLKKMLSHLISNQSQSKDRTLGLAGTLKSKDRIEGTDIKPNG